MQPYSQSFGAQQRTGNQARIGCTMLAGTGKQGVLKPDADGYYTLVLGAYGTKNSAGMFYDEASGVSMFAPDSSLMRRLRKGVLFMEFKHPEPYKKNGEGMSDREYLQRIRSIDDDRVCAHIRALTIVDGPNEHGQMVKMVLGEVKPYGPYKSVFEESLNNPHQNTYCSVRSITQDDVMRGIKYTREISTWDFVGEGGIYIANKYQAPGLESFADSEMVITPATLWGVMDEAKRRSKLGLECGSALDVTDLAKALGWERHVAKAREPAYINKW